MLKDPQKLSLRTVLVAGPFVNALFIVASFSALAQNSPSPFTTIDVAGAGTGPQQGTSVTAIDASGDVAGVYVDAQNAMHCFVRPAGGAISQCDVTGAGSGLGQGTIPSGINSSGVVVGAYIDANQASHGFVRAANGAIATFDAPGASTSKNRGTTPLSINDSGVIVGTYTTGNYSTTSVYHGFMRAANGTITNIDAPNAGTGEGPNSQKQGTTAYGVNASGEIAGYYIDSNTVQHGFVRSTSGTFTAIDPPGVGTSCVDQHGGNFGGTSASSIDAAGDVVGTYRDTSCAQHGYIRAANGTITPFDAPGADKSPCSASGFGKNLCGTFFAASDAAGDLVGGFADANGIIHGFLRPAATGIFTTFDDPNAGSSGSLQGTLGISINANATGIDIGGGYGDTNSVFHGFTYTPSLTTTTTTLTPVPTPNPSAFGEPVTLTATVSSSGGAPPNGENVTFLSGTTSLGTASITSGVASFTTTALPVGTDPITAVYGGDSDFSGSTSTAVNEKVAKAGSTTTLTSSTNPSSFGQSVTLTSILSGQFGGVVTGTVTFNNGSTSLGSVSVSSNSASLTLTALPQGSDSITAVYSGDSNFTGSTSSAVSQVVTASTGADEWTWMGGNSTTAVYGTLGTPATGSIPGGRDFASSWTDKSGNLWLFGGFGYDASGDLEALNDLWEFNTSSALWVWMGGSKKIDQAGVYGTIGVPAAANIPGSRYYAARWTDSGGRFWLFGGAGRDGNGIGGGLNDLWEFKPSTGQWVWMGGSSTIPSNGVLPGVYGTPGTPAAGNAPGSRNNAATWTDAGGNLWLYGGLGFDANGVYGDLNDLWEFRPSSNQWAWMGGSSTEGNPGVYGTLTIPAAGNIPGSRAFATTWTDAGGNLWLFGGQGQDAKGSNGFLNDLWEFNPSTNEWTWMGGSSTIGPNNGQAGAYGTMGVPASGNTPGSRLGATGWLDGSGNLWLFGGEGLDVYGTCCFLNDLWEFNPSINQWAWMDGSKVQGQLSVYGSQNMPAAGNIPGGRYGANGWVAGNGNLWLFGGLELQANNFVYGFNDLWMFQLPSNSSSVTATPAFSPGTGTYTSMQTVTISDTTAGATIYYTTNGTAPTTNSTVYSGPITVPSTETLEAIATASGYSTSAVATAAYTINLPPAATPTFSVAPGTYTSAQTVSISDTTPAAVIYYTTNGTTPTTSSTVYSGSITVSSTETLEAIATASGYSTSAVATAAYTIATAAPTLQSIAISPANSTIQVGQTQQYAATGTYSDNSTQNLTASAAWASSNLSAVTIGNSGLASAIGAGAATITASLSGVTSNSATLTVTQASSTGTTEPVGTTSPTQTATIHLPNSFTLGSIAVVTQGAASLDFNFVSGGTCTVGSAYSAGLNCSVNYTFKPVAPGLRMGAINLYDNTSPTPVLEATFALSGTGVGPLITFGPGVQTQVTSALNGPYGVAVDGNGNIYVADTNNSRVVLETPSQGGYSQTVLFSSGLKTPRGVALDGSGNVYIADWDNNTVFKETLSSGSYTQSTVRSGLNNPWAVAVDAGGNVYIADSFASAVLQETPSAGGYSETVIRPSGIGLISGIAVDANGNIFVSDWSNGRVLEESPSASGYVQSTVVTGLSYPVGLAVDGRGDLYIASSLQNGIVEETPSNSGYGQTTVPVNLNFIEAVAVDASGNVYLASYGNSLLVKEDFADAPSLSFATTQVGSTSSDSPQTVIVQNSGNAALTFPIPASGSDPSVTGNFSLNSAVAGACPLVTSSSSVAGTLAAGASCLLPIGFEPLSSKALTGSLVLTDNNLNAAGATQTIALSGTGIGPAPTPTFSEPAGTYTSTQTVTISDAAAGATIYYTINGTTPTTSSTVYSGPITVSSTETLEAIATASGYSTSAVATAAYTITPPAATPTFLPVAGTYTSAQSVTIGDTTAGATIYYTTNGTTPTTSSTVYSGPIAVSSTETLEAIATASGYSTSAVATAAYTITPPAATPTFLPVAGTYTSAQSVTIGDTTTGATIYYTTNGTTPTTSSTVYSGPIAVSSTESLEAIATASGYSTSAVATAAYTITPPAATPTFLPVAGTYTSAQSVTIGDTTTGATIYYTTNGTTPTTSSTVYSGPITVSSTETLEAIATASGYSTSAVATAAYTISAPTNPVPVLGGLSPAFTGAGGAAFTLTVTGTGFTTGSTVYWGTVALATTYTSATQLTAQVPAADIVTGGIAVSITVVTPAPGGGTSNALQFEVDSSSGTTSGPTFTSTTATVTAGATATYPVTLQSNVSSVSVTCLNLPAGASCSYSSTAGTVTIATSSTTPKGTYQITVVFAETVPAAATAGILLPILLLPLVYVRRRMFSRGSWPLVCLGLILVSATALCIGCGGSSSSSGTSSNQTQQVTSSGAVSLTVQ
jgi:N-acetylneuraminic acid mutarotase